MQIKRQQGKCELKENDPNLLQPIFSSNVYIWLIYEVIFADVSPQSTRYQHRNLSVSNKPSKFAYQIRIQ